MNSYPVQSSNLASVGYDSDSQILEIMFRNGSAYQFFNVPEGVYQDLVFARSKGSYFHSRIKDRYRACRIR